MLTCPTLVDPADNPKKLAATVSRSFPRFIPSALHPCSFQIFSCQFSLRSIENLAFSFPGKPVVLITAIEIMVRSSIPVLFERYWEEAADKRMTSHGFSFVSRTSECPQPNALETWIARLCLTLFKSGPRFGWRTQLTWIMEPGVFSAAHVSAERRNRESS
jgi:hypothetical protein